MYFVACNNDRLSDQEANHALSTDENADWEAVQLSTHLEFMALIERSRVRQQAEGGISSAEMRCRLGLTQATSLFHENPS